jgi:hypothetical protein
MNGICSEKDRLSFVEKRDGKDGAIKFSKQGVMIYRRCVLQSSKRGYGVAGSAFADKQPHHASYREYRRKFIESYLAFKKYIAYNK